MSEAAPKCLLGKPRACAPRARDGSGCICDLRAARVSDWAIARRVGAATYAQLLDHAPGLFEPFPDFRTNGNTTAAVAVLECPAALRGRTGPGGWISREDEAPPPPNLVSTVLAEGALSPADLKRALLRAAAGRPCDPLVRPLLRSSRAYRSPELTLGEIVAASCVFAVLAAAGLGAVLIARRRWRRE